MTLSPRRIARGLAAYALAVPLAVSCLVLGARAFALEASPAKPATARQAAVATPEGAGLEPALASVDAEKIRADIEFVASPELEGRNTPSRGLRIAARYIAARLERLGLEPMGHEGYFFQYPLLVKRYDREASRLSVQGTDELELVFGEDFFLHSTRDLVTHDVTGEVVFCGSGTKEDFEGVELAGRWALCFLDDEVSIARRRKLAERAEAVGIVLAEPPTLGGYVLEKYGKVVEFAERGAVSYPSGEASSERRIYPQILLPAEATRRVFAVARAREQGQDPMTWLPKSGTPLGLTIHEQRSAGGLQTLENVCGLLRGQDPELAKEVILVSAHYDHDGIKNGEIYPGADDNGSGTTGLLALAEALTHYEGLRRSVLFIWVSGEEKGLYGSRAWAQNPLLPEGLRPFCNVNIDMIGRNAPDKLFITPSPAHKHYNGLTRFAESFAPQEGFPVLESADEFYYRSDHKEFAELGIPVAFLFNGVHADYHQPTDTTDKIDTDKIRRVVRIVVRMIDALQVDDPGL